MELAGTFATSYKQYTRRTSSWSISNSMGLVLQQQYCQATTTAAAAAAAEQAVNEFALSAMEACTFRRLQVSAVCASLLLQHMCGMYCLHETQPLA
jgi:hypothetical protein